MTDVKMVSPLTGFGQVAVAEETPQVQIEAIYGLTDEHETFSATGGSATASSGLFVCQTGTSVGGYGVIRSLRDARYRPGQSTVARFTASFTTGIALSVQGAGLFTAENDLIFGYNGADFGIRRRTGGFLEIQRLTISAAATGAETLVVTLDGTATNVSLTSGTTAHNAWQVANTSFTGWNAYANGSTVTFVATAYGDKTGAFTATSAGTAAGSFAEVRAGASPSDNWTAQTSWNENTCSTWLDPTKLNVYEIVFQYLGAGQLEFRVEDPASGRMVTVHRIKYTNSATTPSIANPTFKIGWFAASLGSSGTNLAVKGASAMVGTQGKIVHFRKPRALQSEKTSIGATLTNVLTIRNRATFNNVINYREIWPLHLSIGFDGTGSAPCALQVLIGATLPGSGGASDEPNFTYRDQTNSCVEYDTSAETVTGGTLVAGASTEKNGSIDIHLDDLDIYLSRGETITIAVNTSTGSVTANATLMWYED